MRRNAENEERNAPHLILKSGTAVQLDAMRATQGEWIGTAYRSIQIALMEVNPPM